MFAVDILLCFISAYYTDEYELIDGRWKIAHNYLTGWFAIDVIAIVPFEHMISKKNKDDEFNGTNVNDMIRLARLGRLYKILRLMRLFRVLKLGK